MKILKICLGRIRTLIAAIVVILVFGLVGGCTESKESTEENEKGTTSDQIIKDITPKEAYDLIKKNKDNKDFIIIDVRTPEEYKEGHIKNAKLIDFNAGEFDKEVEKLDKGKKYLIYCRIANRSGEAATQMMEKGFKEVYNMEGGIVQWEAEGFPVEK